MKKLKPDTKYEGSWADEEAKRKAASVDRPLPEWWGKPSIIGPLANSVYLCPLKP